MSKFDDEETALVALGDQVQQAIEASGIEVVGFVLLRVDGAEYRSRLSDERDFATLIDLSAQKFRERLS